MVTEDFISGGNYINDKRLDENGKLRLLNFSSKKSHILSAKIFNMCMCTLLLQKYI